MTFFDAASFRLKPIPQKQRQRIFRTCQLSKNRHGIGTMAVAAACAGELQRAAQSAACVQKSAGRTRGSIDTEARSAHQVGRVADDFRQTMWRPRKSAGSETPTRRPRKTRRSNQILSRAKARRSTCGKKKFPFRRSPKGGISPQGLGGGLLVEGWRLRRGRFVKPDEAVG